MGEAKPLAIQVAIGIVRREGRLAVGRRRAGAALEGFAEFPGGKIEPGENPRDAVRRECAEELGIDVRVLAERTVVRHRYEHGLVELHFFDCEPAGPADPLREPFEWTPLARVLELDFPPANAEVLDSLRQECQPHQDDGRGS